MQTLVFPAMEKCNNTYPPREQVSQEECIQRGLAHRNKRASRLLSKANGGHSCDPAFLEHQSSMSIDRYSLSRFNIRHCTGSCSHHRLAHPSLRGWILLFAIVTVACYYIPVKRWLFSLQGLCVLKKARERRQNPSSLVGLSS